MRTRDLCTVLGCLLAVTQSACAVDKAGDDPADPSGDGSQGDASRYIAILASSSTETAEQDTQRLADQYGFEIEATWAHALQGIKLQATEETAQALASDPDVAYVEPDGMTYVGADDICDLIPDDPLCDCEANPGSPFCDEDPEDPEDPGDPDDGEQILPPGIAFVGGPISATDKIAWVIDSGIDLDHPDLNVDVGLSTFFAGDSPEDEFEPGGHGTRVAGIIGAIDNDIGVVGVSPGNTVVSVRTQEANGSGSVSSLVAGIDYVVQNGAPGDVINMSVSAVGQFQALEDAVLSAASSGFVFAVSAGNEAQDVDASSTVPAKVNHPNVFTVSAIGDDGCLAGFSNFGASVDVTAPGVAIVSTGTGGGVGDPVDGTSFSAPTVAGLLLHKVPGSQGEACNDPDGIPDPLATF